MSGGGNPWGEGAGAPPAWMQLGGLRLLEKEGFLEVPPAETRTDLLHDKTLDDVVGQYERDELQQDGAGSLVLIKWLDAIAELEATRADVTRQLILAETCRDYEDLISVEGMKRTVITLRQVSDVLSSLLRNATAIVTAFQQPVVGRALPVESKHQSELADLLHTMPHGIVALPQLEHVLQWASRFRPDIGKVVEMDRTATSIIGRQAALLREVKEMRAHLRLLAEGVSESH